MSKYAVIFSVISFLACLFFVVWVHASFTSGALNTNNTFTAAAVFPTSTPTATPTPTPDLTGIAKHVVISEVQISGGTG